MNLTVIGSDISFRVYNCFCVPIWLWCPHKREQLAVCDIDGCIEVTSPWFHMVAVCADLCNVEEWRNMFEKLLESQKAVRQSCSVSALNYNMQNLTNKWLDWPTKERTETRLYPSIPQQFDDPLPFKPKYHLQTSVMIGVCKFKCWRIFWV